MSRGDNVGFFAFFKFIPVINEKGNLSAFDSIQNNSARKENCVSLNVQQLNRIGRCFLFSIQTDTLQFVSKYHKEKNNTLKCQRLRQRNVHFLSQSNESNADVKQRISKRFRSKKTFTTTTTILNLRALPSHLPTYLPTYFFKRREKGEKKVAYAPEFTVLSTFVDHVIC